MKGNERDIKDSIYRLPDILDASSISEGEILAELMRRAEERGILDREGGAFLNFLDKRNSKKK